MSRFLSGTKHISVETDNKIEFDLISVVFTRFSTCCVLSLFLYSSRQRSVSVPGCQFLAGMRLWSTTVKLNTPPSLWRYGWMPDTRGPVSLVRNVGVFLHLSLLADAQDIGERAGSHNNTITYDDIILISPSTYDIYCTCQWTTE